MRGWAGREGGGRGRVGREGRREGGRGNLGGKKERKGSGREGRREKEGGRSQGGMRGLSNKIHKPYIIVTYTLQCST